MEKQRKSNFELLRIVAMLFIVFHHLAVHGVQHRLEKNIAYVAWNGGTLVNKIAISFFAVGGGIGVGIFFMITGYFLVNKKNFSVEKVVFESMFYGIVLTAIYLILRIAGVVSIPVGESTSSQLVTIALSVFNPATGGIWWFVSAYVFLMLILPVINKALNMLTKEGYIISLIAFWAIWYSVGSLGAVYHNVVKGIFFYAVGGYFKLYGKKADSNAKRMLYITMFIIVWNFSALCIYKNSSYQLMSEGIKITLMKKLLSLVNASFCRPVCAILIFKFFESIDIGSKKIVNRIARSTFGVYIIHDFVLLRTFIWNDMAKIDIVFYRSKLFPVYAIIVAFVIFAVCVVIDIFRQKIAEPAMMRAVAKGTKKFKGMFVKAG